MLWSLNCEKKNIHLSVCLSVCLSIYLSIYHVFVSDCNSCNNKQLVVMPCIHSTQIRFSHDFYLYITITKTDCIAGRLRLSQQPVIRAGSCLSAKKNRLHDMEIVHDATQICQVRYIYITTQSAICKTYTNTLTHTHTRTHSHTRTHTNRHKHTHKKIHTLVC